MADTFNRIKEAPKLNKKAWTQRQLQLIVDNNKAVFELEIPLSRHLIQVNAE